MTRRTTTVLATVLSAAVIVPPLPAAAQLAGLIEQNIKAAKSASERLGGDPTKGTPQLWIHVRSAAQQQEVQGNLEWFKHLQVAGRNVDVRPIQQVNAGPQQSQLRFFRSADQSQAQTLLTQLRKSIPSLALQDMSSQYRQVSWIDPGHFELWLAPTVTRIAAR
jgi:hypothetical protein